MRSSALLVSVVALSWIAAAEAFIVLGAAAAAAAVALGGLAALKGAAIVGYAAGRHHRRYHGRSYGHHGRSYGRSYYKPKYYGHYRYGRSVQDTAAEETEDLLLATVGRIDPYGCIPKLVCQLQAKEEATRSLEEELLVGMFTNSSEGLTSSSAAFFYASDVGLKTRDAASCKKFFPACPLEDQELSGLLNVAWGCNEGAFESTPEETSEEPLVEAV